MTVLYTNDTNDECRIYFDICYHTDLSFLMTNVIVGTDVMAFAILGYTYLRIGLSADGGIYLCHRESYVKERQEGLAFEKAAISFNRKKNAISCLINRRKKHVKQRWCLKVDTYHKKRVQ